jgi:NADPH:quinone reductase-like Zn-dependent oxidoreductase
MIKAFIIKKYGKKEKLQLSIESKPKIKDTDILVEIHATAINLLDSKIKNGEFKLLLPYKIPLILGHDLAGIVVETGSKVMKFKVGDEVYARPADFNIGTFAEFIAFNEADAALKPKNISMEEAASIPLVGLTAWQAMVENANLKADDKVFIQAGAGGVGTFAIQLAKHLGLKTATTTSSKNIEMVKSLGADFVIDYKTQDFEKLLQDYDYVLNSQDNKTLLKSFSILKAGGQIVSISGPPTPEFAEELGLPWFMKLVFGFISSKVRKKAKREDIDYSFLFMKANGNQLEKITQLIEAGIIKPVVDKVYPFDHAQQALEYVESGRAKGKVVLKIK